MNSLGSGLLLMVIVVGVVTLIQLVPGTGSVSYELIGRTLMNTVILSPSLKEGRGGEEMRHKDSTSTGLAYFSILPPST